MLSVICSCFSTVQFCGNAYVGGSGSILENVKKKIDLTTVGNVDDLRAIPLWVRLFVLSYEI